MTTAQLLIVCTTTLLLAFGAGVLAVLPTRLRPAPSRTRYRVTAHLQGDVTIAGTLHGEYEDWLVLTDAEYVTTAGAHPMGSRESRILKRDLVWLDVYELTTTTLPSRFTAAPADMVGSSHVRSGAM